MPHLQTEPGVELYFEDYGDGTPVVFVNGMGETHVLWGDQVSALSDHYRTVTYDWRGVGRSSKPRTGYTLDALVDDLSSLIEHLDAGPAVLVAQGTGNNIVLETYYRRPDLVMALALVSGAPWRGGTRDGVSAGLPAAYRARESRSRVRRADAALESLEEWKFHQDPGPAVKQMFVNIAIDGTAHAIKRYSESIGEIDHRGRLEGISCPVLVMHGRHNRKQNYEGAEYLASHIPTARLVTFENSAHHPEIEEMERFNAELGEFLRTVSGE